MSDDLEAPTNREDQLENFAEDLNCKLATAVYRQLWKEFYQWEEETCVATILGLSPNLSPFFSTDFGNTSSITISNRLDEDSDWFTFEDWDHNHSTISTYPLNSNTAHIVRSSGESMDSHPHYTSCTSASKNVRSRVIPLEILEFLPFADDPAFQGKSEEYLRQFCYFGWQVDLWDPDREIIFLELSRRLHFNHNFAYADIDELRMFHVLIRKNSRSGLIWETCQRDKDAWPGSQTSILGYESFPTSYFNPPEQLLEDIEKDSVFFCDNLNCVGSACMTHGLGSKIALPSPTLSNQDMMSQQRPPCPLNCFQLCDVDTLDLETEVQSMMSRHLPQTIASAKDAITLASDTLPCDLAIICQLPCFETYILRLSLFTDEQIHDNKNLQVKIEKEPAPNIEFYEELYAAEECPQRATPCHHIGPCNRFSNCSCYNNKQRCQRTCCCPTSCKMRFEGCKCTGARPCDIPEYCICTRMHRECDPDVCLNCDARCAKGIGRHLGCRNVNVQQARFPRLWIHPATYGMGAFTTEKMGIGKYIGEYVGEVIPSETYQALDILQRFTQYNYAFGLSKDSSLDSSTIGNETRYLNHSNEANCEARVLLVNGDPRIALFAKDKEPIDTREELFLDYGGAYWQHKENE
ncbi:hypothetical protein CPB83DRAFT_907467 [Crepidotus variabilis]|uniref:Uncharacterized protein n=1 Tax=Crepidotus variabilis TaxID=179855 RepID=A0A9P6EET9_9AGAR|nr:hypothetical protein CPB83DRAFT_907467 [Crepidotus variabilis]